MGDPDTSGISRRAVLGAGGAVALAATAALLGGRPERADAGTPPGTPLPSSGPAPAGTTSLPELIPNLGSSTQVVIAQTSSWSEIHGTIEAWEKGSHGWSRVLAPAHANVGLDGWVLGTERIQGDMKTPAGVYRIHKGFGRYANPGTRLLYTQLSPGDYWAGDQEDPKTYNIFQSHRPSDAKWRTSQSEALYYTMPAYRYVACIDFNLAGGIHEQGDGQWVATTPANTRIGSGIFLHTYGETGVDGYTEGCVATSEARVEWLLRWFDPDAYPRIVMGPTSELTSL